MRWRIRRDLAGDMENMRFILEEGEPAEKLVEIAAREECDLIGTGAARQESIERMIWGSTIIRLVRGSPVPVLMAQDRGTRPYRRITVATGFSEASFQALIRAAAIFPEISLTLFHAYAIPLTRKRVVLGKSVSVSVYLCGRR